MAVYQRNKSLMNKLIGDMQDHYLHGRPLSQQQVQ